jgi:hypothetical protein
MPLETKRAILQAELDAGKTIEERRRLGQFSTPCKLAREVVSYSLSLLDKDEQVRFFDPAFGTGSFYSALLHECDGERIESATGVEVDPHYALPAIRLWKNSGLQIHLADFTKTDWENKWNLLICNPPYVRHHLLDAENKKRIKERTRNLTGVSLSGLAGLYCHFLLQSVNAMKEDGVAAWLIPSEFMDVNYGVDLKRFLLSNVELLRIHRFNPAEVQFDDALVSSAVVWFRNRKPTGKSVEFSFGGTVNVPNVAREISRGMLNCEDKWMRFPGTEQTKIKEKLVCLSDCFEVKRGIATGNNDFFILEKTKIEQLGLPFECFRPVLPSARFLDESKIEADEHGNPKLQQLLFLLDCRLPEDEVKERYPSLWSYLSAGKDTVANGYLCKSRKCWYYQEQREAPLYVCTYMGRTRNEGDKAFRFIYNTSNAIVTNSYLALYPKGRLKSQVQKDRELQREVWEMLNGISPSALMGEGRVYGGGLHKIEPCELLNVAFPEIARVLA